MATIVVNKDNSLNVEQFISSLYLYKGVQKVVLEENLSYPKLDKSNWRLNWEKPYVVRMYPN